MKDNISRTELNIIIRFFTRRRSKYIFLVVDDERILNYLVIKVQVGLKEKNKEILDLKLKEENLSVYGQVKAIFEKETVDGLIITNLNRLIYKHADECINLLNISRDAFANFDIPMAFVVNSDNLSKIINGASDFYQLRDLPDFHFVGTGIEEKELMSLDMSRVDSYADSDLKAELLEEQLKILNEKKKIDKDSLNSIVMPLLNIYIFKGYITKMKDLFKRYIKGKEELVKHKMLLGDYYSNVHEFEKALSNYKTALDYFKSLGDKGSEAAAYHQIGIVFQNKGDYNVALKQYEKSLEINEKIGDNKNMASTLHNIGMIYHIKGEYDVALRQYEKALEISEKIGDIKGTAYSLGQIGNIFQDIGKYDEALKNYKRVMEISKKTGDISSVSKILHQIGMIYQARGDYKAALRHYENSLDIKKKIGNIAGVSKALHQIGMIYQIKGNYDAALKHYEKSLEIQKKIEDVAGLSKNLHSIGNIYFYKNNYDAALKQYEKAMEISEKTGDIKGISGSLHQTGIIYQARGDYDAALNQYEKAMEISEKIGDIANMANSFGQMGNLYFEKGNYPQALHNSLKAFLICTRISSPEVYKAKKDILAIKEKIPGKQFNEILKEFGLSPNDLENRPGVNKTKIP
ncbi:MAG: tetratricopeptide repeat protein [Candidatus Aminicenantes bacterium]|nr:tetratricopeptide repeat protein [Candidatus Aminicenantes bacterium]